MTWLIPSAIAHRRRREPGRRSRCTSSRGAARSPRSFPRRDSFPQRAIHARTRSLALTDVLLLLLRVLAIMLLGVAVAGPLFAAGRRVTRIVIADRSRAVANIAAVRDSVRAYLRAGDELIVFDSSAASRRRANCDRLTSPERRTRVVVGGA